MPAEGRPWPSDDNDDDNNDNENKDNNNNKNNKIDYLQAGTSTSNGKGLFKSMFRKKILSISSNQVHGKQLR